jgi:hypothetical protein
VQQKEQTPEEIAMEYALCIPDTYDGNQSDKANTLFDKLWSLVHFEVANELIKVARYSLKLTNSLPKEE